MVKHNNVTPNQHYHKQWATRVRTWFDQPAKKQARRLARKAKAAKIAPRPTQLLRPAVHCPTLKYNTKVRLGKGFTLEELKEAGVSRKLALTIGIAVDHRRQNKSVEAFETNVARLKAYKSKLIVFPRRSNQKPKAGDAKPEETAAAVQATGVVLPLAASAPAVSYAKVTPEMKEFKAYATLRTARTDVRMAGIRQKKKDGKKDDKDGGGGGGGDE